MEYEELDYETAKVMWDVGYRPMFFAHPVEPSKIEPMTNLLHSPAKVLKGFKFYIELYHHPAPIDIDHK